MQSLIFKISVNKILNTVNTEFFLIHFVLEKKHWQMFLAYCECMPSLRYTDLHLESKCIYSKYSEIHEMQWVIIHLSMSTSEHHTLSNQRQDYRTYPKPG